MKDTAFNYVRVFRQRHALEENELADLIGVKSHTTVSRGESGERLFGLEAALALQVLFSYEPRRIFPGLYEHVEEEVMRRAKVMIDRLTEKIDRRSVAKREFLEGLAREEDSADAL